MWCRSHPLGVTLLVRRLFRGVSSGRAPEDGTGRTHSERPAHGNRTGASGRKTAPAAPTANAQRTETAPAPRGAGGPSNGMPGRRESRRPGMDPVRPSAAAVLRAPGNRTAPQRPVAEHSYLTVTVAPAPSRAALALSAVSLLARSRTGCGALSTRSLASLR